MGSPAPAAPCVSVSAGGPLLLYSGCLDREGEGEGEGSADLDGDGVNVCLWARCQALKVAAGACGGDDPVEVGEGCDDHDTVCAAGACDGPLLHFIFCLNEAVDSVVR